MARMEGTRIDSWLWAVRLLKTRGLAAKACRAGHVQINGERAKPAAPVKVGDTVRARVGERERIVEVTRLLHTRVGADIAVTCYIDNSPPPRRATPSTAASRVPGARPSATAASSTAPAGAGADAILLGILAQRGNVPAPCSRCGTVGGDLTGIPWGTIVHGR
jgi:ribosome-associated heat shock protein Hsp15